MTGGGRGIGRGEALELAAHAARGVVSDLGTSSKADGSDPSPAEGTLQPIEKTGRQAVVNPRGASSWSDMEACVAQAIDTCGGLDIVIAVHLKGTFNRTHRAWTYWQAESKAGTLAKDSHPYLAFPGPDSI